MIAILKSHAGKSYPHATVIQPTSSTTTGVVTFPDEQPQQVVNVSQPQHVIEPAHYQDSNQMRGAGPLRIYPEDPGNYDRFTFYFLHPYFNYSSSCSRWRCKEGFHFKRARLNRHLVTCHCKTLFS